MTFTEAAVEVLRLTGKPLHYKQITELAIEKNLLSHVGKTPETTMSSRLATMVKKDRGDAPIVKVKPGVFALREFPEELGRDADAGDAADDSSDAVAASNAGAETKDKTEDKSKDGEVEAQGDDTVSDDDGSDDQEEQADQEDQEDQVASPNLPGSDVFPEEDDDDDLILANLDDESGDPKRSNRRRRGRRRRDRDEPRREDARPRDEGRSRSSARSRSTSEARTPRTRTPAVEPATRTPAAGEMVGKDLADAIEHTLRGRGRDAKSLQEIAEALIGAGRLSGSPTDLTPTVAASIRGDNARRRASFDRTRFREADGTVVLVEWDHPSDAVRAEQDAIRAAERQQISVRRALVKRMREFPDGALLELIATWLNALGVHSIRGVRAEGGDFSLAGTLRRGPEETPLAISIYRGQEPIGKESIVGLRGVLHTFDHARAGWIITLGQVRDGIEAEVTAEGAAPCAIFDAETLAQSMEDVGVGLRRMSVPMALLDVELLDALGGPSTAAESPAEANGDGSKRRRGRRRGRRRSPRDGDTQETQETQDANDAADEREDDTAPAAADQTVSEPRDDAEAPAASKADSEPAPAPAAKAKSGARSRRKKPTEEPATDADKASDIKDETATDETSEDTTEAESA